MCLTEPQCGTDLGMMRTKAVPQEDGSYRISGAKIFISAGEHDLTENIIHLVLARLPDAPKGIKGVSMFLVPKFVPERGWQAPECAQWCHLHRDRTQDGAEGVCHHAALFRRRRGLAGRRTQQRHEAPCSP